MKSKMILSVAAVFFLGAVASAAVLPVNLATTGTATAATITNGAASVIQDQSALTQLDTTSWAAITWAQPMTFNKVIFEQCPGYVVAGAVMQIAKTGVTNPNGANDADWQTLPSGSYSGGSSGGQSTYAFGGTYTTTGVRLKATDVSNIGDLKMRPREIWVYQNYNNLALTASSVSAPGWTDSSGATVRNESFVVQEYTGSVSTYPDITFTWAQPQTIAGAIIAGGSGAVSEHLIDYEIQYLSGTNWLDALAVTGNTQKYDPRTFAPVTSTQFRLHITKADNNDGYARVSEIMFFPAEQTPVPEPATLALVALGGLGLLLRRRA